MSRSSTIDVSTPHRIPRTHHSPPVHSMRYLRRSSTVLFSSVLAAASRFFRKDLHRRLLSHAQTVLDRALTSGASDIGIVQSLMILTYWKNPADTSAWRKIGMALRMGYQSLWHVPRRDALPEDEAAARQVLVSTAIECRVSDQN
jgi:hypothetical protein